MKKYTIYFLLISFCIQVSAQSEKEILLNSKVKDLTVFLNGAQVIRKKTVELNPGRYTLRFVGLSPFLDTKSIHVSANNDVIILSVNNHYKDSTLVSDEWEDLNHKAQILYDKVCLDSAQLVILQEEKAFLTDNRSIGGKNQEISSLNLKATASYYNEQMSGFILKELDITKDWNIKKVELQTIRKKLKHITAKQNFSEEEILVKVDAKTQTNCDFLLSYFVKAAGWKPSYDIRVKSISDPIELVYKANIYQNTKEDWDNVHLKLSSSNPQLGGVIPHLSTYFLNFLVPMEMVMNDEAAISMNESKKSIGTVRKESLESSYIPKSIIENTTSFTFDIQTPYSIKPDGKSIVVEMDAYSLPASYIYTCIPKLDKDAFLTANIVGWEKYNLLNGETNIYFENTFVGKSKIDLGSLSDTLAISLGRDKNIMVNREKVKDFNSKQFLGNKQSDTRIWHISIKNNKLQPIHLILSDQVPVSSNGEIEVITDELSAGTLNKETGEVKWDINMEPTSKKEIDLKYSVKYPKNKTLLLN